MMERGELLAEDVLPLVGDAFAEMARQGGALDAMLKSGRVQQSRFVTAAQEAADIVYNSGFEDGISKLFATMTESFLENTTALKGLGQVFEWLFDTIGLGVKLITPIVSGLMFVMGRIANAFNVFNDFLGNNFVSTIGLVAAGLTGLIVITRKLRNTGMLLNVVFAPWLLILVGAVAILDEIFSLFYKGRVGVLEEFLFGKDLDLSLQDLKGFIQNLPTLLEGVSFDKFGAHIGGAIAEGILKGIDALWEVDWDNFGDVVADSVITLFETILKAVISSLGFFRGIVTGATDKLFDQDNSKRVAEQSKELKRGIGNLARTLRLEPAKTAPQNNSTTSQNTTVHSKAEINIHVKDASSSQDREKLKKEMYDFWTNELTKAHQNGVN